MADNEDPKAEASAEKAYAAAAEAVSAKPEVDAAPVAEPAAPLEFPAKAKRARKPAADPVVDAEPPAAKPASVPALAPTPAKVTAKPVPTKTAPAKTASIKAVTPKVRMPAKVAVARAKAPIVAKRVPAKAVPIAKPAVVKPAAAAKPVPAAKPIMTKVKPALAMPAAAKAAPKSEPVRANTTISPKVPPASKIKEITMQTATEFTDGIQKVATEAQQKTKKVFEKGSALLGECTEFAKGNVDAFVESGKIFAAGVQEIGSSVMTESKTAFETMTSDVKELAASKSPNDFLSLQTEILRRNFDKAVALSSKNSEAMMKLASDSFSPISSRVSLAVGKIRAAA